MNESRTPFMVVIMNITRPLVALVVIGAAAVAVVAGFVLTRSPGPDLDPSPVVVSVPPEPTSSTPAAPPVPQAPPAPRVVDRDDDDRTDDWGDDDWDDRPAPQNPAPQNPAPPVDDFDDDADDDLDDGTDDIDDDDAGDDD
ncbi:hypothetical protein V1Y59_11005 [Gordonia sp. PKS22-38]|uniref:Uncharacterized protein n=1 Tax=Gordonia prachuapensis TaxID=3115651 RepID=A0ABU7MTZ6_9ACTN|nr:hypothetical protein [Gordonia sp. PKS22-38]